MNWGLIKRSHLHTRPAPTAGLCTIAEEADVDYAFLRLQKLEETNRAVQRECKALRESLSNLARAEQKLTSDLSSSNFVHDDDHFRILAEEYHSVNNQMGDFAKKLSDILQITVSEPLKKYGNEFASAQAAVKKRDQFIADLLPARGKLEKLRDREKTGNNIVRAEQLRRQTSTMEAEFKAVNCQLLADMNLMLDLRADYIEPSFLAFIRAETDYYGECTRLFNSLVHTGASPNNSPLPKKSEPSASELIAQFNQDMQAIRALSIVSDK